MFYFDKIEGKTVLKSDFLNEINHFFTTKELLLKTKEEKNVSQSLKNREFLKNKFKLKKMITPSQRHTDNIKIASLNCDDYDNCDGLILKEKELGIFLNFADCTPLLFYDERNNTGAISHAGWRGTAQKIGPKTVEIMKNEFNSNPKNIIVLIGPCICFECFETGDEVIEELSETVSEPDKFIKKKNNKYYADLKGINKAQLNECGVLKIDVAPYCTCCNNDTFYSYRMENKTTNRMSAFLSLN